jgi:predicted negative regulator of RcsB-dependent stress response
MSTQSLFSKKNIQSQQPDTRRGLLEELNLPPEMITFIRKNARNLQIGLICVAVLVLAWIFYDYYTEMQEKKGASLLASGLQTESTEQRIEMLENVINDYGRTDAARWSKLELAHLDYKDGRFEAAAAKYKEILETLPAQNSLVPLTRLNLAQSYEEAGQFDQAIAQYSLLKKSPGFINQAFWGLGRMYMAKEDTEQARKTYEELLSSLDDTSDPGLKLQLEAKLASLDAGRPVISSQPEAHQQ